MESSLGKNLRVYLVVLHRAVRHAEARVNPQAAAAEARLADTFRKQHTSLVSGFQSRNPVHEACRDENDAFVIVSFWSRFCNYDAAFDRKTPILPGSASSLPALLLAKHSTLHSSNTAGDCRLLAIRATISMGCTILGWPCP